MKLPFSGLFFFLLISGVVFAHPPDAIHLSYQEDTQILKIVVDHNARNIRDHFIRRIVVLHNKQEIRDEIFPTQSDHQTQIMDVSLKAENGDRIRVKAYCSQAGYKEKTLDIVLEEDDK